MGWRISSSTGAAFDHASTPNPGILDLGSLLIGWGTNNWYRHPAPQRKSLYISSASPSTKILTAINHISSAFKTRMLRQHVLRELCSSTVVRQGSRSFRSLTHGRNASPFLSSLRPTLLEQLNLSSPALEPQVRVLATSAPRFGSSRAVVHKHSRVARTLYKVAAFTGFAGLTITGLVVAFFAYDASTYKNEVDSYDVGVSELAMNPRRGGPKNLPIAEILVLPSFSFHKCIPISRLITH